MEMMSVHAVHVHCVFVIKQEQQHSSQTVSRDIIS